MRRIAITLASLLVCTAQSAQAAVVDWKYFGSTSIDGSAIHSFYEVKGIKHLPNHHLQVWTKGMDAETMNTAKLDNAELSQAAGRFLGGYKPPYASVQKLEKQQFFGILGLEAQANEGSLTPRIQTLWEIDCTAGMDRTLSIIVNDPAGKVDTKNTSGKWLHAPPQSMAANLNSMVCV
jgi:hypothetical protein